MIQPGFETAALRHIYIFFFIVNIVADSLHPSGPNL